MKIEALIAIKSKGKKDISAILSSMNIDSDARIAVYHYNGAKEETFDYRGHVVCVHYIAAGTKMAAYNELLKLTDADVVLFADPTQKFVSGYRDQIESAFESCPKCDGILFGVKTDGKRVGMKEAMRHSFAALCMKTAVLRERRMTFIDVGNEAYNEGATNVFRHEFVAWPSRYIGKTETILENDDILESNEKNRAFYDSRRYGMLWWVASTIRFFCRDKEKRGSLRVHLREAAEGYHAYFLRGYNGDNKPIKENLLPFVVTTISMLGFAVQLVLSLLIVFTEVQYIPIWVSLIFLVVFVVIYSIVLPKVHNAKAIRYSGVLIGLGSFIGMLVACLLLKVSWAMSTYGAFVCLFAVLGVMFCFAPRRGGEK